MKTSFKILNGGYNQSNQQFVKGVKNTLTSLDGENYIDMTMGAGSLIFGHADEDIVKAIEQQAKCSPIYLQNNPVIQALGQKVSEFLPDNLSNYIFCNTGSEATQRAIRLARAATGKMHIASFQGGWHGMNEWTLLDDGGRFGETKIRSYAGIPDSALEYSLLLPYNDESIWPTLKENADKLAAIIIEPIQGSNPQPAIKDYLTKLVKHCRSLGILVIFDEIITGFRVAKGGASQAFNLEADIVTYGKVLGGGLPMGLVACNQFVYDNTFAEPTKSILTGGTFSANPLSAAAGLATLNKLTDEVYARISDLSDYFRNSLNQTFQKLDIPFMANGYQSISRIYFTNKPIQNRKQRDALECPAHVQSKFREELWKAGIIWPTNGIVCMPATQTKSTLDTVITHVMNCAQKALAHK
ncbi:aminotransferase class III-fold pyridoxal phosphate-dependent enzyme [Paraglaciecola aquimarina]|uniref:Aminotransferase class III-fold pyridoxal phosphate-dependent enzyme n=1 Tax=Paraglaciecola algarum TaxID=3050085 RepID=A0ABS9D5G0_9ALTE|nr:aminotransferase class III-fold pyridoxal phosphate-dependent enzyme [Paraglaciecola sp. G1-23]MCF2948111.1 aminotransferase class III-fold pyridoxal phosphate-dependent enzyme [Paraglaciecola sp. G1-23]